QVAGPLRDAVAMRPVEPAVGAGKRAEQELGELDGRGDELRAVETPAGLGQRGEREAVPGRDRLVVAKRLRPALALLEETAPELGRDIAADDPAPVLERLEQLARNALLLRPREGEPLHALGVGVLRRGEAAVLETELPQHVAERLLGDAPVPLLPRDEPPV